MEKSLNPEGFGMPGKEKHINAGFLKPMLCGWHAEHTRRSEWTPHAKTFGAFFRAPDDGLWRARWFLVTSANISQSAWGSATKQNECFVVNSYEIGVLFVNREEPIRGLAISSTPTDCKESVLVPIDIPPIPYGPEDRPFAPPNE